MRIEEDPINFPFPKNCKIRQNFFLSISAVFVYRISSQFIYSIKLSFDKSIKQSSLYTFYAVYHEDVPLTFFMYRKTKVTVPSSTVLDMEAMWLSLSIYVALQFSARGKFQKKRNLRSPSILLTSK